MKKIIFSVLVALVSLTCLSGCKKSNQPPPPTEFRPSFADASPEIKAVVNQVMMNLQGSLYSDALKGLAKLAANPALTEVQKKAVSELTEQVKAQMAAVAAAPK